MPSQSSLFSNTVKERIHLKCSEKVSELVYLPAWLATQSLSIDHHQLYHHLKQRIAWEQSIIQVYGKAMPIPRLNAWYGDTYCTYTYSGASFMPLPWLPILLEIKQLLENTLKDELEGQTFNSALVNCYRNGQDSVAWHSDDEPELGRKPLVASVSLGAERIFQLRHKYDKNNKKHMMTLSDGDLLLMAGETQRYWQHQIPKSAHSMGERISITYRRIYDCS